MPITVTVTVRDRGCYRSIERGNGIGNAKGRARIGCYRVTVVTLSIGRALLARPIFVSNDIDP